MERNRKAAESLLEFLPFMHEKFLNPMERLAVHGMSKLQFFALMMLFRKGPQTMTELASGMQIAKQQMTPLVDRLLELKLGRRLPDAQDRRVIRIEITQAGKDMITEGVKQNMESLAVRLRVLPEDELIELEAMMIRVRELLEKVAGVPAGKTTQRGSV